MPKCNSNIQNQQKMAAFYTYVYRAIHICSDPSNLSNELNDLKSLAVSQGYNPFVIDKALNKFKKIKQSVCYSDLCLNPVVLPFYSSFSFKISFHLFVSKSSLNLLTKLKSHFPKILFLLRTWVACILVPVLFETSIILSKQKAAES